MMNRLVGGLVLAVGIAAYGFVFSGHPVLGRLFGGGLPAGNLVAAIALAAPPIAVRVLARDDRTTRRLALILVGPSLSWGLVSFALAGNAPVRLPC